MKAKLQIFNLWRMLIVLLMAIGLGADLFFVRYYLRDGYDWHRDINNQETIGKAYAEFYLAKNRFPESLGELVRSGYLPHQAKYYAEPPLPGNKSASVESSCYVVQPPPNGKVQELKMIGRLSEKGSQTNLCFEPLANAMIRDTIIARQSPRDQEAYNNYIAPLIGGDSVTNK